MLNFNDITKAFYENKYNKPKPIRLINKKELTDENIADIEYNLYGLNSSDWEVFNEAYIKLLKSVLAIAYINDIDLNKFIKIEKK